MKRKIAIVCAWREGETDLDDTLASAAKSAGKSPLVYAIKDKDGDGPGRTRHRGIEAAGEADIVIIIDAHMRFQGNVLSRMASYVWSNGGLSVPFCHHNRECSFDATTASGKHYYAGARIVYRAKNGRQQVPLEAKWARSVEPGPRGAVMGACYAFRRDWYYTVGQPLSALPGWGCDEEALSIACWMSGYAPYVIDGHVAHRYRDNVPWTVTPAQRDAVRGSRAALIHGVVSEAGARHELMAWGGIPSYQPTPEAERFRKAVLALPRKWRQWRDAVCEPDEFDGKQESMPAVDVDRPITRHTHIMSPRVILTGVTCVHCHTVHDPLKIEVTHTYPNGSRRHMCPTCGNPFISRFVATR